MFILQNWSFKVKEKHAVMAITHFNAELTECLSLFCSNVLFKYVAIWQQVLFIQIGFGE